MPKENKTKYAILGVLNLNPASGYDIKKFCDNSIAHFWSENFGHIYPVLKQLEEEGLVVKATEVNEGKLRNVYSITGFGKEKLVEWLKLPSETPPVRYEFLLKMFFSSEISGEIVLDRLKNSLEFCKSLLQQYEVIEEKLKHKLMNRLKEEPRLPYWYSTVRYGILDLKAKMAWCEESIALVELYGSEQKGE